MPTKPITHGQRVQYKHDRQRHTGTVVGIATDMFSGALTYTIRPDGGGKDIDLRAGQFKPL